jgi:protein O-mannosyl-transferase
MDRMRQTCTRTKPHTWDRDLLLSHVLWLVLAATVVGAALYSPALHGRFVFDDDTLPFRTGIHDASLGAWLTGVRPFLMFSYWVNYRISGEDPYGYHVLNLLIHAINTSLVFMVLLRLLSLAGWCRSKGYAAAVLGATVFLIHPLATESVSYIAGRSEALAALFMLLAYVVFLGGNSEPLSWRRSILVLMLFGVAVATKEHAVALAGVLLLTDLSWPRPFSIEGVRRNHRLYLLMTPSIVFAGAWVARVLKGAESAGFSFKEFTWYQYAFTQARAMFAYIRLAVFPLGQSVDHDFPVSRTVTDYGAIFCMALLVALVLTAILFRVRYPLACFGLLLFLILLAPTSSVIPIADPLVERRMYLPMVGLILIACQWASRMQWSTGLVSLVVVMLMTFGGLCYQRNRLWGKPEQVWASAAQESTSKGRPYLGLAESLIAGNHCADAIPYLERGEQLMPRDFAIQLAWGKVLECQGKREDALKRLERAADILPNSMVYQLIGLLCSEMGRTERAGTALHKAEQLGPGSSTAHSAMGLWYESVGNAGEAEREYRAALALYPYSTEAQAGLARIQNLILDTSR